MSNFGYIIKYRGITYTPLTVPDEVIAKMSAFAQRVMLIEREKMTPCIIPRQKYCNAEEVWRELVLGLRKGKLIELTDYERLLIGESGTN